MSDVLGSVGLIYRFIVYVKYIGLVGLIGVPGIEGNSDFSPEIF